MFAGLNAQAHYNSNQNSDNSGLCDGYSITRLRFVAKLWSGLNFLAFCLVLLQYFYIILLAYFLKCSSHFAKKNKKLHNILLPLQDRLVIHTFFFSTSRMAWLTSASLCGVCNASPLHDLMTLFRASKTPMTTCLSRSCFTASRKQGITTSSSLCSATNTVKTHFHQSEDWWWLKEKMKSRFSKLLHRK